jgi:hypothetical protein
MGTITEVGTTRRYKRQRTYGKRAGRRASRVPPLKERGIIGEQYSRSDVGVEFPIDPEGFFVNDPAAKAGPIKSESPERMAA